MRETSIQWTDHTFNPWWGCTRVSPGCEHCYAESFAKRVGQKVWGVSAERRFFGEKHWNEPIRWNARARLAGERHRVFCASMPAVFDARVPIYWRKDVAMREAEKFVIDPVIHRVNISWSWEEK